MASVYKTYPVRNVAGGMRGKEISSLLPDGTTPASSNLWFLQSKAYVRNGLQPSSSPPILTGRVQKFYDFYNLSRTQFPIAVTESHLYYYNTGSATWTSLNSGLTGTDGIPPSLDVINGKVVVANGGTNGQVATSGVLEWDGVAASFTSIAAAAPQSARHCANYGSHFILAAYVSSGGTNEPVGVIWSDLNAEGTWGSGDSGSFIFSDTQDVFMGLAKWGDYLVLLRRYSVWLITPAPSPFFYQFDKRSDATGCVAPGSVQVLPIGVVYLGDDGMLYLFNGVTSVAVGEGVWPLWRGGQVPTAYVANATSAVDLVNGLYILSVPFGAGATDNTATFVWNYLEGSFAQGTEALSGLGVIASISAQTWNVLTNGWNTYGQQWTAPEFSAGNPIVYASQVGKSNVLYYTATLNDVGSAISWSYEAPMRDFGSPNLKYCNRVAILYQGVATGSVNVQVGYTNQDDRTTITWLTADSVSVSTNQILAWFADVPSIWKALKISSSTLGQNFILTGYVFFYKERGPILA